MPKTIYFDHASSTPVWPEVIQSLSELYPKHYANSESLHSLGLEIHAMIEKSRESIAAFLRVEPSTITFTSGATEANNLLIKGIAFAYQNRGKHLITSQVEHASVLESFQDLEKHFGFEVTYLPVDTDGFVHAEDLKQALRMDTTLVSIMAVNNEVGNIMPTQALADIIHRFSKAIFHVDAVQALSKIDFSLDGVDAASFSAHKMRGVKGSGVIYKKNSVMCQPLITGGQQESGLRPGTPSALHHILFAKTLRLAIASRKENHAHILQLRDFLIQGIQKIDAMKINSPLENVSPYILNVSCLKVPSQVMLNYLDSKGICVSAAATCSSRQTHPSHVLAAMGIQGLQLEGALRISIGATNTLEECHELIEALKEGIHLHAKH